MCINLGSMPNTLSQKCAISISSCAFQIRKRCKALSYWQSVITVTVIKPGSRVFLNHSTAHGRDEAVISDN